MASTKTRHSMVFLKDGTTVPTASAADPPPARLAALRPEKVNRSGTVQSTRVFGDEAGFEHNMYAVKEAFTRTGENRPAGLNADSVSPDSVCKGVRVTLDNNSMWNECFRCRTEMILTKQGSRMFPYCRFRISGLQQCRKYVLVMDIQPLDSSQYRWTEDSWQVSRKAECQIKTKPFIHPESPATGQHWMQGPVSFYKLKLTNNTSDQEGNIILHPLHRYLPRLHLVETDKAVKDIRLNGPNVLTFAFPQTEFMTVTTYQNPQFAQLKVNYNPFAKGLKEDGSNLSGLKLKTNSGRELNKDGGNAVAEQHPVKKSLKFLLANHKPRCSKAGDPKPSAPKELQRSSDYSAAVVPGESPSSNSRPAQKLISQLICEAHVSLQRSSSEQRSTDLSSPVRAAQNNTKTPTNRDDTAAPAPTGETSREMKDDDRLSDPQTPPDVDRRNSCDAAPSAEQTASSDSAKQQKRPARLPLPALALFLKQHSAKHKRSNSKLSSPPPESSGPGPGPEDSGEAARTPWSPANRVAASDSQASKSESLSSELEVFHDEPDMSNSETPKVCPSTCSTSPEPPHLSPPLSTVLSAPNSPKTPLAVEDTAVEDTPVGTSSMPSGAMKTESLLFDPECSSLGFEPMSPASSPEPLPPLPASLAFEIDPASSVAAGAAESAQDPELASPSSVFTWHTVLPPPDTYVDSTFTAFQPPPPQASPLKCVTPPLLPCLDASAPPDESAEPSLPFPAELSPLALQLSLSPTFSSLDENGLSPAPSLSELVHFFSTDVDIGIGGEFSNPEVTPAPSPPPPLEETQAQPPQAQPAPARKPSRRKRSKSTKLARLDMNQNMEDYRSLQPNLEEVEEQLFVSFASKEALRLHVPDSCEEAPPPDGQQTAAEPKNHVSAQSLEEMISGFQKILLKDLEVMKYRQVIHPVLQEVGLKMTLLDPALSIDLQYLGVHLPIPAPGVGVEPLTPSLSSPEGSSAAFLSRTGKTTDVTQIKGWKEKFTPSETASGSVSKPEAGPSSEPQKKNLSAFCSDMLDEYLENEAKLIDERAASFSQPPVEPPVYKLPVSSTSYVRTLDHVLKKQTAGPPASDLISGFIPPSKRPRFKEAKTCRRSEKRLKSPKLSKPRPGSGAPESSSGAALSETTPPLSPPTFKRRRKLKPTASSQTLGPPRLLAPLPDVFQGLAPVESDSELAPTASPKEESSKKEGRPRTTRALLRQKDLEDCVALEGRFRTSITEERAAIALTSLFTQTGFVSENPTAPIQLKSRRRFPCLNEFCRLGCVCSSLSHSSRSSHCGRPACMFGCSCLKQKVVLLKNLDSSDSSPTPPHGKGRKKRRRRMKMAYVLKEADSVSRPAERVQTLWRKNAGASDPELVFIPNMASVSAPAVSRNNRSSCARVRGFRGKMQKQKKPVKDTGLVTRRAAGLKGLKQREPTLKETNASTSNPPAADEVQQLPPKPPESPPPESTPKPSKRLFIKADCKWASDADRSSTVKKLCEAMAREQLTKPFWIKQYLIVPIDETVEGSGANQCIQYRVQITTPKLQRAKGPVPGKPASQRSQKTQQRQSRQLTLVPGEMEPPLEKAEPLEEVSENLEPPQVKQEAGKKEAGKKEAGKKEAGKKEAGKKEAGKKEAGKKEAGKKEAGKKEAGKKEAGKKEAGKKEAGKKLEAVEDWQKEIEGSDTEEERESRSGRRAEVKQEKSSEEIKPQKKNVGMATPCLKGATPAGFISADRKQKGGTDHLVQVNGESLHPEPRLVGFLTGQVGSQPPGSGLTPHTVSASPSLRPTATCLRPDSEPPAPPLAPPPPKDSQVMLIPVQSSAGQRMVLQQIPSASGTPYYRRPDGKLVQLIPINHLRPVELKAAAPTDLSSSSSSSSPSLTPAVKKPSLTTLIVPSSSSSLSPAVFSPVPLSSSSSSVPVHPQPVFVADQSPCSMEVLSSSRDPVFVSLPSAQVVTAPPVLPQPPDPPPAAPIDLSSRGQRTEREVKAASAGPEDVVVQHKTASPVTPPPAETLPPPPESPEQELARDPMDLDIISVYDEAELVVAGRRPVDVVELTSSSDTENSSDFRESDSEDEKLLLPDSTRHIHNMNERRRRVQLQRRFSSLRKEMGHTEDKLSKVSTLTKAAKLIRELRCTEDALRRKKRRLRKRRDKYLSLLDPSTAADQTEAAADDDEVVEVIDVSDDIIEVSSDEEKLTESDRTAETDGAETFGGRRRSCEEEEEEEGMTRLKESRGCGAVQRTEKDEMETRSAVMNIPTSPRKPPLDQEVKAPLREMEKPKSFESSLNHEKDEEGSWKASGREKLLTKQELKVEETLQEANQPPAGGGAPVAPPTGDTQDYITPSHPQWTTQAPPPCAVGLSISVLAHPTVSHNAPGTTKQPKTVPNILSRSKNPPRPPSLSAQASEGAPSSQEPLVPAKVLSLVGETLPTNPFLTVSPVIVGATFLRADPPPAPVSSSLPLFAQTGSPLPPLPPHLHQMQPSFSHPGPGGPPLLLLSRNQDPSQTLRPAAFGPGQRSDSQPGGPPPGPDPRRDPDSERLSTLLDEIVFLNQKTVASATAPEKPLCEDLGGAGEQACGPGSQLRPPDSVDPRLIDLMETDAEGEQPGPDSVNTNCGILAPPPLLHMKMGGAKVGGLSRSDGAAADGVGSVRGGGGGWRPMPRLVPLGVRGNSPS